MPLAVNKITMKKKIEIKMSYLIPDKGISS